MKPIIQFFFLGAFAFLLSNSLPLEAGSDFETERQIRLERYKLNYPPFDYKQFQKKALGKFTLAKPGDFVSIKNSASKRTLSGKYYGNANGKLSIGGEHILLKNIQEDKKYLFSERKAKLRRLEYIQGKFDEYKKRKTDNFADFANKIKKEHGEEPGLIRVERKFERPKISSLAQTLEKPPRLGVIKQTLRVSGQAVKKGEIVRILSSGRDKVACERRNSAKISVSPDAVRILDEARNPKDYFSLTQAALDMAQDQRFSDAILYATLAEKLSENSRRASGIKSAIFDLGKTIRTITSGNSKLAQLEKDGKQILAKLASNQQALRDDFAIKAGARDRSPKYMEKLYLIKNQQDKIREQEKRKLAELQETTGNEVKKFAADGDFISAAILCDCLTKNIAKLRRAAAVTWSDNEKKNFDAFKEKLKASIKEAHKNRIKSLSTDMRKILIDKRRKIFGNEKLKWKKTNAPESYESILNAANNSLAQIRLFDSAMFKRDFNGMFKYGIKILALLPDSPAGGSIGENMEKSFEALNSQIEIANKFYKAKMYGKVSEITSNMTPMPEKLRLITQDANKKIAISRASFEKARVFEQSGVFSSALDNLRAALKQWPCNPDALKYYKDFKARHGEICEATEAIETHVKKYEFTTARGKCERLYKELPKYNEYLILFMERINDAQSEYFKNMAVAENYLKAGRLEDAYKIYSFLNNEKGKQATLEAMLLNANKKKEWNAAVAILEKLGRWEEAGELRKKYGVTGVVKAVEKTMSAAEIFNRCKGSVVVVIARLGSKTGSGSGFAITEDGYIVTNKHCVSSKGLKASRVTVNHPDWKQEVPAKIVRIADDRDLALLKIDKKFRRPVKIGNSDIPVGSKVYALGNPASNVGSATDVILQLTFTDGIISAQDRMFMGNPCLQTTATINHGNSGGPLIDQKGRAVGVNTFSLSDLGVSNTYFAIKMEEAKSCFKKDIDFPEDNSAPKSKKSFFQKLLGQ